MLFKAAYLQVASNADSIDFCLTCDVSAAICLSSPPIRPCFSNQAFIMPVVHILCTVLAPPRPHHSHHLVLSSTHRVSIGNHFLYLASPLARFQSSSRG